MKKLCAALVLISGLIFCASAVVADNTVNDNNTANDNNTDTAEKPLPPNVPDSSSAKDVNAVFVFNRVCYGQVPNTEGIVRMSATLGWSPLSSDELALLSPVSASDTVHGWDTPIGERAFRVTLIQGAIAPALIETFPDFANGQSTSCTLVLDGRDEGDVLLAQLEKLAGKAPAKKEVFKEGLYTTTWAGGNADIKVFLIAKTDKKKRGTLINVVVLTK